MPLADLEGSTQAFVTVRRGQADVDDDDVQRVAPHLEQELVRVSALGEDVEPRIAEESAEPLA